MIGPVSKPTVVATCHCVSCWTISPHLIIAQVTLALFISSDNSFLPPSCCYPLKAWRFSAWRERFVAVVGGGGVVLGEILIIVACCPLSVVHYEWRLKIGLYRDHLIARMLAFCTQSHTRTQCSPFFMWSRVNRICKGSLTVQWLILKELFYSLYQFLHHNRGSLHSVWIPPHTLLLVECVSNFFCHPQSKGWIKSSLITAEIGTKYLFIVGRAYIFWTSDCDMLENVSITGI